MKARVLSHEERLEMTRRNSRLLFEQVRNGKDLPQAAPGIEELPKFNPDVCEYCGSPRLFHEAGCVRCIDCGSPRLFHEAGCVRCIDCGWSRCG